MFCEDRGQNLTGEKKIGCIRKTNVNHNSMINANQIHELRESVDLSSSTATGSASKTSIKMSHALNW